MIFAFGARRKVCSAKGETKAIDKLCVREILSLSFVCGAYFFEFRGRNLVCFGIAYNFNGKFAPKAGKTRMRTAFFTHAEWNIEGRRETELTVSRGASH